MSSSGTEAGNVKCKPGVFYSDRCEKMLRKKNIKIQLILWWGHVKGTKDIETMGNVSPSVCPLSSVLCWLPWNCWSSYKLISLSISTKNLQKFKWVVLNLQIKLGRINIWRILSLLIHKHKHEIPLYLLWLKYFFHQSFGLFHISILYVFC